MVKIIKLRQRTPEWLAWRKHKISASMVPTIMGINPHKTPLQLYDQLMNGEEEFVNPAMQRGIDLEGDARKWAEDLLGCSYPEACIEHKHISHFIASFDGFNNDAKVKAIEIKCPGPNAHHQAKMGVVPSYYYAQVQWQMYVADLNEMYYVSYDGKEGEIIKVKADAKTIEHAISAAHAFRACLISYTAPEPCDRDLTVIDDQEAKNAAFELSAIEAQIKGLELIKEGKRRLLIEKCNGRSCKIGDYRMVRFSRRGAIDYTAIPELQGKDLEEYRKKPIESWRFS